MAFNILIADDSTTMRAVVKKTVEMAGVPVNEFYEAANGREALDILADSWIDVILSDINMPVMGGMELLRAVRSNKDYMNIPLVFITTESSEARMSEAKKYGVSGYIKKPFVPETIKSILYEVLEKAYDSKIDASHASEREENMDF